MASRFHVETKVKCQGVHCKGDSPTATYRVEEKQDLCEECAIEKEKAVRTRASNDIDWSCEKHQKAIEYVCRTHGAALCQTCAFVSHQRPCEVQDLEDAIRENRERLEGMQPRVAERRRELRSKEYIIQRCGSDLDKHFKGVGEQVATVFTEEIEKIDEKEREERKRIQKRVSEQIKKIEAQRDAELRLNQENSEAEREKVNNVRQRLTADLSKMEKKASAKASAMMSQVQTIYREIDDAQLRLEKILISDKDLMRESKQVEVTLTETLSDDIDIGIVERTLQIAKRVRFEDGDTVFDSRISGIEGSWEMVDSIPIQKKLIKPFFIGSIGEDHMVISDLVSRILYVTNLEDKTSQKVLECPADRKIVSCKSLDKDTILCGNFYKGATGKSFKGASLYSRDWELIRDVELPKKPQSERTFASVHVDKGGRIIAAVACQSDIHIINPDDGTVTETVRIEDREINWLCSLSSGNFIAKTGIGEFTILDISGEQRNWIKNPKWDGCLCDVDLRDDSVYVVYRDVERKVFAVDRVRSDENPEVRRIVEYPFPTVRKDVVLPCVVTPSGRLVTCNGEHFFVFKLLSLNDFE